MARRKTSLKVGDKIRFRSGNFAGENAVVTAIDWHSVDPRAIYGYYHTVQLADGRVVGLEKAEHWEFK